MQGKDRNERDVGWIYWGASGVLQPLSSDFLYRSPSASPRRCRSCRMVDRRTPGDAPG